MFLYFGIKARTCPLTPTIRDVGA